VGLVGQGLQISVIEKELPLGVHAEFEGDVLKVDPKQMRYLDLLHESRHVAQIGRAEATGVEASKYRTALFEKGAYEYELRLGERMGFSEEYQAFAFSRIQDYVTPSIVKKARLSPSISSWWNTLWR
jgi:hypothetical protein